MVYTRYTLYTKLLVLLWRNQRQTKQRLRSLYLHCQFAKWLNFRSTPNLSQLRHRGICKCSWSSWYIIGILWEGQNTHCYRQSPTAHFAGLGSRLLTIPAQSQGRRWPWVSLPCDMSCSIMRKTRRRNPWIPFGSSLPFLDGRIGPRFRSL